MVFDEYAAYYDLLYRDKNYAKEADYIYSILKKNRYPDGNILELGCGTGRHADLISGYGYTILGIDASAEMLNKAQSLADKNHRLTFRHEDIRAINIHGEFDVCISLFHVMSYINSEKDFLRVLTNVKQALKKDGIFIFDTWYGPAVLSQLPEVRVKRFSDEVYNITRIAEPVVKERDNIVEVHYDIFVEEHINGIIKEIKEMHSMRYWFLEEILRMSKEAGFVCVDDFEFGTNKTLSLDTWGSCFILKKV